MRWTYEFAASAREDLKRLGHDAHRKILLYLEKRLASGAHPRQWADPYRGDMHGYWKIRVGAYRLIAKLHDRVLVVEIIKAGDRRDVYE